MIVNKTGIDLGTTYKNYGNRKPSNNRQAGTGGNNSKMLSNQAFQGRGLAYQGFYIPFTGGINDKKANAHKMSKLENIMYYADTPTKNMINTLKKEAKASGFDKITTLHVMRYGLAELDRYIEDLDSGKKDYNAETAPPLGFFFGYETSDKMIVDSSQRALVKPVIKQQIELVDNMLYSLKPGFLNITENEITLSDDLIDSIWSMRKENEPVDDYTFIHGALSSPDEITSQIVNDFTIELDKVLMQNNKSLEERAPFSEYEKKAENVLKNLSLGTNIFLTFDRSKESPENFLDTVYKVYKAYLKDTYYNKYSEMKDECLKLIDD